MASIIASIFQTSSLLGAAKSLVTSKGNSCIGDIVIDATINEMIQYSSTVTEHPVETRSAINDHIFKQPLRVKIEGYITDTPLQIMGLFETPLQRNTPGNIINDLKSHLPFQSGECPSKQAYKALKALYEDKNLVSVVTKLEVFSNMAITNLQFTNNLETGGKLEFVAELCQVTHANVETTMMATRKNTELARITSPTVHMGNVDKGKSYIAKAWDKVSGWF